MIRYICDKTDCDPALILCQKLVRRNRNSSRPLTFLSFKLNVPESLENIVTVASFWPTGITIKPFLANRQSDEQAGPPLVTSQHQNNRSTPRSSRRTVTPRRQSAPATKPYQQLPQQAVYSCPNNLSWPPFQSNQLTVPSIYQYMPLYRRMPEFTTSPIHLHNSNIQQSTMV